MDRYTLNRQIEEHPDAKLKDLVVQMLYDDIISLLYFLVRAFVLHLPQNFPF